jgi:antitoxin component of MazEF toxin-antitoxin module
LTLAVADEQFGIHAVRRRSYTLRDLLAEVTDDNPHGEVPTGEPRGRESW